MTKLDNLNFDKIQIVIKIKNSHCDKTKAKQVVTKLKNLNCDTTQKLNFFQNSIF